jgi:paraquat-inducible protein A
MAGASSLILCHDCGLLHQERPLPDGAAAKCTRCGAVLYKARRNSLDRTLMLSLAALSCFVLANVYPFLTFKMEGREQQSTLITGVIELYQADLWLLAVVVLCASILLPLIKLLSMLAVLLPLKLDRRPRYLSKVFRLVEILHPWAMMEVYLLGVFVAYVKLVELATLELGIAIYSFVALIVLLAAADASLDPRVVWERLRAAPRVARPPAKWRTTLVGCHACDLVSRLRRPPKGGHLHCPRCGTALHRRKPNSLARTTALVVSAAILYIPANLFPVMTVISFGKGAPDTILSGVKQLMEAGMWPLALLVFFASITVPVLKLLGLSYLLISVRRKSQWRPRDRTRLYRITEAVGRWSMIDIFMISILVALVKLGSIATIEPGVGATSFAAVVIITMIAAMSFDPRLIWDNLESEHERTTRRAA